MTAPAHPALAESDFLYRTIFENSLNGIVLLDRGRQIVMCNEAMCRLLGYSRDELVGQDPRIYRHPDEEEAIEARRRARLAGEDLPTRYRRRLVRKDGTSIEIECSVSVIDAGTGITGVMVSHRDVTAERGAAQALERSERRYRTLVETAQSGIVVLNAAGNPDLVNAALCRILGYTSDELMEMNLFQVIHPDDRDEIQERFDARVAGDDRPVQYQVKLLRKDGETIDAEIATSLFVEGDRPAGALVEVRDISDRLRLREQLLQSQKLEAVGTLVAGVAHDFNNLLTAIGGSIELAREEQGESLWLERAAVATDRAGQLVRQLMQFSRHGDAKRHAVDLTALAQESVDLLGETIDRRIAISVQDPGAPLLVWADQGQLQQVMMNLLCNARDALVDCMGGEETADYLPSIVISFDTVDCDGKSLAEFTVTDNGSGMTPEVRARVFDPFFTTKGPSEGSGLGLSTAYGIVSDHDGSLTVESTPSQGTRFVVRLPAYSDAAEEEPSAEVVTVDKLSGQGQRVLIVDDEPVLAELAESALERAGYLVDSATDGVSALEIARRQEFALVMLDVNMPAPNGWDVLSALLKERPDQRVLMVSGLALEREARDRGALGLLHKPFDRLALLASVDAALQPR